MWRNYTPLTNVQASVAISPGNRAHGFGAESGSIYVTLTSPGLWRAWSTSDWLYVWAHAANTTDGQVGYQLEGGTPAPGLISDSLVDPNAFSSTILPPVYVSWDGRTQFIWKVVAPVGMKIVVQPPPGAQATLLANWRWDWFGGGSSLPGLASVQFEGLQGESPVIFGTTSLSSTHQFFGLSLESTPFTNTFSFTSMTLVGAVPRLITGVGGPLIYAAPR